MVKIYLKRKTGQKGKEFIEVDYFSFLKAFFLGWIGLVSILWGFIMLAFLVVSFFGV